MSSFHGAFATGVASQQGTLTLPDTWFRPPFWDLLMLQLLRPNSSNLPCLYSTFHLEYPLVLSRFYFRKGQNSYKTFVDTLELDLKFLKRKTYTKVQVNMPFHIGEECAKQCFSCILGSKRDRQKSMKIRDI